MTNNKSNKSRITDFYGQHLEGMKPLSNGWYQARCRFHDDKHASFNFSAETGGYRCHACGVSGGLRDFCKAAGIEFPDTQKKETGSNCNGNGKPNADGKPTKPPINPELPEKYHQQLLQAKDRLDWLIHGKRGFTEDTIRRFQIGWNGKRYSFPVWDERKHVVNIRLYDSGATDNNKMISYASGDFRYGDARLYGLDELVKLPVSVPVVICEGEADRIILEQNGFHSVTGTAGVSTFPASWAQHFKDRPVYICFDNDEPGRSGALKVAGILHSTAAAVRIIHLPSEEVGPKGDITDYFIRLHHTPEEFQTLMVEATAYELPPDKMDTLSKSAVSSYFVDGSGNLFRFKETRDGKTPVKLANFSGRIVSEVLEDDGQEQQRFYAITGRAGNKTLPEIQVKSSQFGSMAWLHQWGNAAVPEPGTGTKDYIRHSIQTMSGDIEQSVAFTHTGWRIIGDKSVYLSASGGIGAENITVRLPREVQRYCLPLAPENETEAIKASLSFLDIAPRSITMPLYALLFLTPLTTLLNPMPNFSGYLYGESGSRKSSLSVAMLAHFGHFNSVNDLQNFHDTCGHIEKRAFVLKDALLVVDDYCPSVNKKDADVMEKLAQSLIRNFSNRTARGRLNADVSDRGRFSPRGMMMITGEELISIASTLARTMVIEVNKGEVDLDRLASLQRNYEMLSHAMTSYLSWVRIHVQDIQGVFSTALLELRKQAFAETYHPRVPEMIAFLQFSVGTILNWLYDKGIVGDTEADELKYEAWEIFHANALTHSRRIQVEDPVKKFQAIFGAMIDQGHILINHKSDYNQKPLGDHKAELVGWYDDFHYYILPRAMWHSLQIYCSQEKSHFPLSEKTLKQMLIQKGIIVATGKGQVSTAEWIQGKARKVLKFSREAVHNYDE